MDCLHMVHDGFPVSVLGQCPLFWFQNQNQTVRFPPLVSHRKCYLQSMT